MYCTELPPSQERSVEFTITVILRKVSAGELSVPDAATLLKQILTTVHPEGSREYPYSVPAPMPVEHTTQHIPAKPIRNPTEEAWMHESDVQEWERQNGLSKPVGQEYPQDPREPFGRD